MALEIRQIKEEELDAFNRNVRIAFASPDETFKINVPVEWTLCAFEDGKLATSYMAWPLTLFFDRAEIPVAGVTMVGTLPIYRRKGQLRKITKKHFETLYESKQQPISALFASMAAIYQRFGYGIVSSKNAYNIEPRYLQFVGDCAVNGSLRDAGDEDIATILEVYHKFAEPRIGCLRRNEKMEVAAGTPLTVLAMPPSPVAPLKFIYYDDKGAQGYVIYSVDRAMGPIMGQNLVIRDMAWLTPQAYRAIWDCLANMDLVQTINWYRVPIDDPLPHLLLEPRKLGMATSDGLLARLIDIKRALTLRPYREKATITFEVIDEFCPWNAGKWKLDAAPSGAEMKQANESPQITMPVSTLAMLMFGQISASEAARMARLDVHDRDALETWDRVMRTPYRPYCADVF